MIRSRSVYGKAPMRQLPHCCLWKWPHREEFQFIRRYHPYGGTSASQAVLSRMQLTLHATRRTPHDALRLALAISAWLRITRRAPSRHCRGARCYSHTTAARYDYEYPSPPLDQRTFPLSLARQPRSAIVISNCPKHRLDRARYISAHQRQSSQPRASFLLF